MYVYIYVYVCTYIYIYIYTYIHTYIHTYICTDDQKEGWHDDASTTDRLLPWADEMRVCLQSVVAFMRVSAPLERTLGTECAILRLVVLLSAWMGSDADVTRTMYLSLTPCKRNCQIG